MDRIDIVPPIVPTSFSIIPDVIFNAICRNEIGTKVAAMRRIALWAALMRCFRMTCAKRNEIT